MILSNDEIQRLSAITPPLVMPWNISNQRLSSYDLTVGDEYYSGCDGKSGTVSTQSLLPGQSFTIPPHGVCFILSEEAISLPSDVTAKVSLRMTFVYAGLVLTSQPPFDPGYAGKVIVMVHNLSSQPHSLKRGQRIVTIEFSRVSVPATTGVQTAELPIVHRSVGTLLSQLNGPVRSSLSEISNTAASAKKSVVWLSSQMLVFAALIVAIIAIPSFFSYNTFADRLADQKSRLEEMTKALDEQKLALEGLKRQLMAADKAELEAERKKAKP